MTAGNLFWDSCVFIRYLIGDDTAPYFDDISRFIEETKKGKWKIHYSTLTFAEIRQEFFKGGAYGGIKEFFEDLGSNFSPIEPNPNILTQTGQLRSARSTNPGDPNPPRQREIATPDAILLCTCLFARDVYGLNDIVFHSTYQGKGKNWAGRAVPIIGFERWYPEPDRTPLVRQICSLQRDLPIHPEPMLKGIVNAGKPTQPQPSAEGQ